MATLPRASRRMLPAPALAACAGLAVLAALTAATVGARQALLLLVAAAIGVTLYHGALGFTAHWRHWLVDRDGRGVRLQLWIVALGSLGFFPLIGGWVPGFHAAGFVAPLALEVAIGAALFGLGMQLANGCGSGTLFTLGGGSTKMLVTLAAFIAGSLLATFHLHHWRSLPELPPFGLVSAFGVVGGLVVQLAVIIALVMFVSSFERKGGASGHRRVALWQGPWPAFAAATALGGLAIVVFSISGQPWSVTFGFTLWGGQLYEALGFDLARVPFWSAGWTRAALDESVLRNATSLTNFGVILGALFAAGMAGRFKPQRTVPWRHALAALLGGLAMGYGARLAFGCNIGAFLGGTMSGSLHGWLWLAAALPGCWLGIKLRPLFRLPVARPAR